jgi:uncharacterized protein YecE (DUF72 family)
VGAWIERPPAGFVFAVKAFRGLTRERQAPDFVGFAAAVRPLAEAGKLACVLAQFPQSFRHTPQNQGYLLRLRQLRLELACVEEPPRRCLMPPTSVATRPVAYAR